MAKKKMTKFDRLKNNVVIEAMLFYLTNPDVPSYRKDIAEEVLVNAIIAKHNAPEEKDGDRD